MSRETETYRDNLEDILKFFGGKHVLTYKDVQAYTGLSDRRTIRKRIPMIDGIITATSLARCLSK